jgi:hypothetical protein
LFTNKALLSEFNYFLNITLNNITIHTSLIVPSNTRRSHQRDNITAAFIATVIVATSSLLLTTTSIHAKHATMALLQA